MADAVVFAFGVFCALEVVVFRIGFAADRADFESAGDIGNGAGAIDALAIESVGVVFESFLRC